MAMVSRLGGAILASTNGVYYLVGDLKEPLAFEQFGFERPEERDVRAQPYLKLKVLGEVKEPKPVFVMSLEEEELAKKLVSSFMIYRNGSISERLWDLSWESSQPSVERADVKDAEWLKVMPNDIWDVVRDTVLRCS